MNRTTLCTMLLAAAILTCGCRSSKVSVSGRFVGSEATTVYLEQVTPLTTSVIDSALLDKEGGYEFLLKDAPPPPPLDHLLYNGTRIPR
ncbi:MAG: AhpC/TSA family protein, partial [Alistipes sp.]|nr:AhpC/TSA family protein [Alistipes sp.]